MNLLKTLDNFIAKIEPEWKSILGTADKYERQITHGYVKAFEALQKSVVVDALVEVGDVRLYPQHIAFEIFEENLDSIYNVMATIVVEAGKLTSNHVIKKDARINANFNIRNPEAVRWTVEHVGQNIREVDEVTRNGIKEIIQDSLLHGGHPYKTARNIKQFIGLTEKQIQSVLRYQSKLDTSGRSEARVDAMVDTYIRRKIRQRAVTIARTETIAAACGGQQLHWEEQIKNGGLNKYELMKEWITTPGDRTCPTCMRMNGQKAEIDGTFDNGLKTPPLHPQCRCAIGLVERPGQEIKLLR